MPLPHPQYDEISLEDQRVSQRLSCSLTTDSRGPVEEPIRLSEEHLYGLTNKNALSGPRSTYALVPDSVGSAAKQQQHEAQKIHWVSPVIMVISLFCGVALTIGHHSYYSTFNDQEVGSLERQQWSLRFGNAFAISTSLCLKTAVGIAYLQVLWRRLSKSHTSVRTINSSFDILGNVFSLFNFELWKKIQIGVLLALILWCLPIPTLFAPATLSVRQQTVFGSEMLPALTLDIANSSNTAQFSFSRNGWGPTPQLERIAGAVAYGGNILPFDSPSSKPNISYEVTAYAPLVRCQAANETEQFRLLKGASDWVLAPPLTSNDSAKWPTVDSFDSGEIGYLAVYDEHDNVTMEGVTALFDSVLLAIQRKNTTSEYQSDTEYISCRLWNATLGFSIGTISGRSRVENITKIWQNQINADAYFDSSKINTSDPTAYGAYFAAVTKYVIGIGWYHTTQSRYDDYITMDGEVFGTTLSFNSQFRNMTMDMASHVASFVTPQIVNKENLRNTSFREDLEQLALNTSISLFTDSQFCKYVPTNVTSQTTLTVYIYQPLNLFISYGLAILFSTLSVGVGVYSFHRNGASYDASFSSIGVAMQNEEVTKLLEQSNATTAQPLNNQAGTMRLRFDPRQGFVAKNMQNNDPDD